MRKEKKMITDKKVVDNRIFYDALFQKIAVEIKLKNKYFNFDYICPTYHKVKKQPPHLSYLDENHTAARFVLNKSDIKQIQDCLMQAYERAFDGYKDIDLYIQKFFQLSSCSTQGIRAIIENR